MTATVGAAVLPARGLSVTATPGQDLDRFLEAVDPRRMGPRLTAALGTGPAVCDVLDAKYQPQVGASVLYRLGDRLVRGDLPPHAEDAGTDGRTVVAPGVVVHPFPLDPDLPSLPRVVDPAFLGPRLADALGRTHAHGTLRRTGCRSTLLRYRPGKRATLLVTFRDDGETVVAKAYHDSTKAAAVAEEADALQATTDPAGVLRFAPAVAHLADIAVVVQRRVHGSPLDALLDGPRGPLAGAEAAVRRAGRAVAELHEASPSTRRERSVEREVRRFAQRATRIQEVAPCAGEALAGLAQRLADTYPQLPEPRLGTVHGDCKPSQFLLGEHEVHLLDMDHLGHSDQAADVGTFLASLRQLALRRSTRTGSSAMPDCYETLADAFLEGYRGRGGDAGAARTRWQEAAALERKALRAFARAPRSPLVTALTTEAHRRLDLLGGSHHHG